MFSDKYLERFWSHVDKKGPDDCWEWQLCVDKDGYGVTTAHNRQTRPHRVAWEITNGPIPNDLFVLHKCDNPPCCNPAHLWLGTNQDNVKDKLAKGRQVAGVLDGNAKLDDDRVRSIKALLQHKNTHARIAGWFGISRSVISEIASGKAWKHVEGL